MLFIDITLLTETSVYTEVEMCDKYKFERSRIFGFEHFQIGFNQPEENYIIPPGYG